MHQICLVTKDGHLADTLSARLREYASCLVASKLEMSFDSAHYNNTSLDLFVIDLESVPQIDLHFFESINRIHPEAGVVVISPPSHPLPVHSLLQFGVDEILTRPSEESQITQVMQRLQQRLLTSDRISALQKKLRQEMRQSQIIAKSKAMREIMQRLPQLAACTSTVLITGETGTGKELIARAIHYLGPRAGQPFVTVDCGALPENLAENELFGHVRGAYTDAGQASSGLIQEAESGTLFLDEVEALPPAIQSKFLRFLQERQYKPLGQSKYLSVNVRVLAATNIDLAHAVEQKRFREDLYFRLKVIPIIIPPLRERRADIPALAHHFWHRYAQAAATAARIPAEIIQDWLAHDWPGNVRELENKVQEWLATAHLENYQISALSSVSESENSRSYAEARKQALSSFERAFVRDLMRKNHGNLSAAARMAQIDRKNLRAILRKHSLNKSCFQQ